MKNTTLRLNDKQGKEHDPDKNEMMVKERSSQSLRNERIAQVVGKKRTEKKKTTSPTNEYEKHPYEEGLNGVVGKINNEKNKLVVGLWKTSQN